MLEGKGAILEIARRVSAIMEQNQHAGAIVGGVAVVLHGHLRTTADVDVYTPDASALAALLKIDGFSYSRARREFTLGGVPVHLVTDDVIGTAPRATANIEGVRTVTLPELINLKLRSGIGNMLRAQDLADVIGLIRQRRLTSAFASRLDKDVRKEFRALVRAISKG